MPLDTYKRNRTNQYALVGGASGVTGYSILTDLHALAVAWFPTAPDELWRILGYVLAAVGAAVIGKVSRMLEN